MFALKLLSGLLLAAALLPAAARAQPSFTVTNITKNAATLNAVNTSLTYWSYQRTAPNTGPCRWQQKPNYSARITGLETNTSYTYKADIGGAACGFLNYTATFSTLAGEPHAPGKPYLQVIGQQFVIDWTIDNDGGSQITKWQYTKKVGNNSFETTWTDICVTANESVCPNRRLFAASGFVGGQPHKFKIRAVNTHGNGKESPESSSVTAPGSVSLTTENVGHSGATLKFSGYTGKWWYQGDQSGASCTEVAANTATATLTGLTPITNYTYNVYVYPVCSSGLEVASHSFTTDHAPLDFGSATVADKRFVVTKPINPVTLPAATGGDGALTYAITPTLPQGLVFAPDTRVLSGTPAEVAGSTEFTYSATDTDNTTVQLTFNITVAPTINFGSAAISDKHVTAGNPIAPEELPAATDGFGGFEYSLTPALPLGLSFNPATRILSGTPGVAISRTVYTYTATDDSSDTAQLTFAITVDEDLFPSFGNASIADLFVIQNESIAPVVLPEASGGNGALQYTLTPALPQGLSFDPVTRTLSGLPTAVTTGATYSYAVTDSDGDADVLTFRITVEIDVEPSFAGITIDAQDFTQHRSIGSITFPAATGGNGYLYYTISPTLPDGLSFDADTRVLSGTPTVAQSTKEYMYQVTDNDGDRRQLTFTIAIAANLLPSFEGTTIAEQRYKQNRPIESVTLPAATGGDGALTYSVTPALPQGLTFDPAVRVLSGTPAVAMDRTEFTYTAADEEGDTAALTLFIAVEEDYVPSFEGTTVGEQYFKQNRTIDSVVLPEATGGDGFLRYSVSPALPEGLSFDPATRMLSGTPTVALERTEFAYATTDEDGDSDQLSLFITIEQDFVPDFGSTTIAEQYYKQNRPIESVVLPEAAGGDGDLNYSVTPALPRGLSFDPAARVLSGTPQVALDRTEYAYTATDEDGDAGRLSLFITVEEDFVPSFDGITVPEQTYKQNQAIEPVTLPEAASGDGDLQYSIAPALPQGLNFDAATRVLSGVPADMLDRTEFTYTATDEDGDAGNLSFFITVEEDFVPSFGGATIAEQQYKQNLPIQALSLPTAESGDGQLTYSVSPALPQGLNFDPLTRVLSGTPTVALSRTEFTYIATDEDGDTDGLSLFMEVEADFAPSFGDQSIGDMRLGRGHVLEPVTLPSATGGDGGLTYVLTPELPDGLQFNAGTRTLSGQPKEVAGPLTYTYSATDSDPVGPDATSLSFSLEVVILAEDKAVLNDILAAQGRALLTGATSAIGRRFGAGSGASTALTQGEALNMLSGWIANAYAQYGAPGAAGGMPWVTGPFGAGVQPRAAAMMHNSQGGFAPMGPSYAGSMTRRNGWRHLLQGRSFMFAPKSRLGRTGSQLRGWTVWSAADFQSFSGMSGANEYDGSMFSLYVGGDVQFSARWLAGAAVSRASSNADYTVLKRSGQMKTGLFSVYPYVHGRMGSSLELWAIGGLGMGEAEDWSDHAGAEAESGDLSMTMAAAGLRQPVRRFGALALSILGGAGLMQLSTEEGFRAVDGLSANITQARLGVELAREAAAMAPYLRLAFRYDGGGSEAGTGVEVVGGARYSGALIDFEAQGRFLAAHSAANYKETGGMARLLVKSRADGSGLSMSLKPGWGEVNRGALFGGNSPLLGESELRTLMPVQKKPGPPPLVMDNDLGYGFALSEGLLTLGARQFRFGGSARESVGLAWESVDLDPASAHARDLTLRLDYQRPTAVMRGGFRVEMRYTLRL